MLALSFKFLIESSLLFVVAMLLPLVPSWRFNYRRVDGPPSLLGATGTYLVCVVALLAPGLFREVRFLSPSRCCCCRGSSVIAAVEELAVFTNRRMNCGLAAAPPREVCLSTASSAIHVRFHRIMVRPSLQQSLVVVAQKIDFYRAYRAAGGIDHPPTAPRTNSRTSQP